jgi:hypothetical protein
MKRIVLLLFLIIPIVIFGQPVTVSGPPGSSNENNLPFTPPLSVEDGGTGGVTASEAITNLSLRSATEISNDLALKANKSASGIDPVVWRNAMDVFKKTDSVSSATFSSHTNSVANPHSVSYSQVGAEQAGSVSTHSIDTSTHGVLEIAGKEHIPTNASFTLSALSEKNFSSLSSKPSTLSGYGISDGTTSSSFSAHVASDNPHLTTYSDVGAEQFGSVSTHSIDTSTHNVLEIAGREHIPGNASFTLSGLSEKAFSSLSGKPTTLDGYGITDSTLNASFTAYIDAVIASLSLKMDANGLNAATTTLNLPGAVTATNATFTGIVNVVGTFTLNGEDVFGDINAALDAILGE